MDKFEISIIKYLGKVDKGIITLININFPIENLVFDATFYYTDTQMILTVPEEIEMLVGDFTKLPVYPELIKTCIKRVIPHNQIVDNIDPLDVKPYLKSIFPDEEF